MLGGRAYSKFTVFDNARFEGKLKKVIKSIIVILIAVLSVSGQSKNLLGKFTIARLKYDGGGDWYSNPSSLPNLLKFLHENANMDVATDEVRVGIMDKDFFAYPYLYMNGHGNVRFSDEEVLRLRQHLQNGGFLHADDNYGLDQSFRREIKRVFPDNDLVELPFDHPIYHILYEFPNGLPKIHEHDNKPPQGLGIFYKGRLVVFYTYECDLGDGWEDPEVHNDPEEKRQAALKMGANIVIFSLMQ